MTTPLTPNVAVGPQYDTVHVYVPPADFARFVSSLFATFGDATLKRDPYTVTVTPTPSTAKWHLVLTPVGSFSVFGYTTPVPFPFSTERAGYLVSDMDLAVSAARANGAALIVAPFNDAIGKDAVIQWPGGVNMQLYWHTTPPSYPALQTIPEGRVYVSPDRVTSFTQSFLGFSHGKIVSDSATAPGIEIGRPRDTYRRVRIESAFGKLAVLVTDGHLPFPYGRDVAGYEVANLDDTLARAKTAGATILDGPYRAEQRNIALVQFPGGYIAEMHSG